MLQLRDFLARHLRYPRRNQRYSLSPMPLALLYPILLGLGRIETASFLHSNGPFQYLTGLPDYPDPQTLRRFLSGAPKDFRPQLHRGNDQLQQRFIHWPDHRSRLILDLDSPVVTVFGPQEQAEVGYNPRYRGKRSYHPLLCLEANSALLWDPELRPGNAGTWEGSAELLASGLGPLPGAVRELRVRADAGFGYDPVLQRLEARPAQYAVVARMTPRLKRKRCGWRSQRCNRLWEIAELELQPHGWSQARRGIVARRRLERSEPEPTLFNLGSYLYRAWITNLPLTPEGVWHFADSYAVGHLFQFISDTIPGLSDSCRSEATLGGSLNGVSDRSQGLDAVFVLSRSPTEGRRSGRPTHGVVAPFIRAGGERRERTSELQFAFPPVAVRNGLTRPSE